MKNFISKWRYYILGAFALVIAISSGAYYYFEIYSKKPEIVLERTIKNLSKYPSANYTYRSSHDGIQTFASNKFNFKMKFKGAAKSGLEDKKILEIKDATFTSTHAGTNSTVDKFNAITFGDDNYSSFPDLKKWLIVSDEKVKWLKTNSKEDLPDVLANGYSNNSYALDINELFNFIEKNSSLVKSTDIDEEKEDAFYTYQIKVDSGETKKELMNILKNGAAITLPSVEETLDLKDVEIEFRVSRVNREFTYLKLDFNNISFTTKYGSQEMIVEDDFSASYEDIKYEQKEIDTVEPKIEEVLDIKDYAKNSNLIEGSVHAKLNMVQYLAMGEPFALKFYQENYPKLKAEYITTGKMNMSLRPVNLDFIPGGDKNFEAYLCAFEQNKGLEFYEAFMSDQERYLKAGKEVSPDALYLSIVIKSKIDLNKETFNTCLTSNKYKKQVADLLTRGQNAKMVNSPIFVFYKSGLQVDQLDGAYPLQDFQNKIKAQLD